VVKGLCDVVMPTGERGELVSRDYVDLPVWRDGRGLAVTAQTSPRGFRQGEAGHDDHRQRGQAGDPPQRHTPVGYPPVSRVKSGAMRRR
jgi:hypothetical protein